MPHIIHKSKFTKGYLQKGSLLEANNGQFLAYCWRWSMTTPADIYSFAQILSSLRCHTPWRESHASTFKNGVIFSSSILILCPDTQMFI